VRHHAEFGEDRSGHCRDQTLGTHYLFTVLELRPCSRVLRTLYPSSRPRNIGRVHGWSEDALYTRDYGPCSRAVFMGARNRLPVFTARNFFTLPTATDTPSITLMPCLSQASLEGFYPSQKNIFPKIGDATERCSLYSKLHAGENVSATDCKFYVFA